MFHKRWTVFCLLVLSIVLAPSVYAQGPSDSKHAVVGRVVSSSSAWIVNSYGDQLIETTLGVLVDHKIKGSADGLIYVLIEGGTVGDTTLEVSSQTSLSVGDIVALYLDDGPGIGVYKPHNKGKGTFKFGSEGSGYVPTGHVWGTNNVGYRINTMSMWLTPSQAIAAIQFAANNWNDQTNANIALNYLGTTSANALIKDFTNNVFFRPDNASGFIAEAYWWWDGSGRLVDADILFHENYRFTVHALGCPNGGYFVEDIGTHEFGHVLGLNHSPDPSSTMYSTTGECTTDHESLTADDRAGIEALYPFSGPPPPPPPGTGCPPGTKPVGKSGKCK